MIIIKSGTKQKDDSISWTQHVSTMLDFDSIWWDIFSQSTSYLFDFYYFMFTADFVLLANDIH